MFIANSTRVPSALYDRTFSLAEGGTPLSPDRSWPNFPKDGVKAEVDRFAEYFVNASTEGKGARPVWTGDRTLFGALSFPHAPEEPWLTVPERRSNLVRRQRL